MKKMVFMTKSIFWGLTLALVSCSNSNTQANNTPTAAHQEEHNHDAHDHGTHDHSTHSHEQEATPAAQTAANKTEATQAAPVNSLPPFTFYKIKSGIAFSNQDIPKNKKSIFILFDPGCGHCKNEANALGKNYNRIKDVNLYFVTMNDPKLGALFLDTYAKELSGKPNVEVLYDRNTEFILKVHVPDQFPANYVFNSNGQLETYWTGDKNIESIIAAYNK